MEKALLLLNSNALSYLNPLYWFTVLLRSRVCSNWLLALMQRGGSSDTLVIQSIGSSARALELARRAARGIAAYKKMAPDVMEWEKVPVTDKASYIHPNHISSLLADNYLETFSIFRSSGSSGKATYWPQLKGDHRLSGRAVQVYLESCFQIHRKKTLVIVGLSLGSWIGGDHISALLKQCSLQVPYPLTIFAPGNHYDEILEILREAQAFADQIILVLCPSAIGHLALLAQSRGVTLPKNKLRYLVLGEAFPESFRTSLGKDAGLPADEPAMFSMYGSADTGELGVESRGSIALRQLLLNHPDLRNELKISGDIPHFFHACSPQTYVETIHHEICVTRWQGVPIIRYNLHDQVTLYHWKALRDIVLAYKGADAQNKHLIEAIAACSEHLPAVIAVYGRADRCLILCGTNITEGMIGAAVKCDTLQAQLTGMFEAKILYDDARQFLSLTLELKQGVTMTPELDKVVYDQLIHELGKVQPEFEDDWKQIYAIWDQDTQQRVLRIEYKQWPELSKAVESGIKHIGIQK